MLLTIDPRDPRPIYQQVTDGIKELIAVGTLKQGAPLPPVRQLAADLGVNLNTIATAYRELQKLGLVTISRGAGCVVTSSRTNERSPEQLMRTLRVALTDMVLSGVPSKEIRSLVSRELGTVRKRRK
jgi:GntR family transcriptional regulator